MHWPTLLFLFGVQRVYADCKCTPADKCWPSLSTWNALNVSIHGRLIHNQPLAESCYPGAGYNRAACQQVADQWANSSVVVKESVGYSYPLFNTCPPINTTVAAYPICDLGNAPVYTVNATETEDVVAGIKFAKENKVRLVIKNTGHDIVGRSQGYGSLMIWIKNIQNGIQYHSSYESSAECPSNWTGSAFTINGGYAWGDVYKAAAEHGHVVVGGNDPTVGAIGGYLQGAGHGPLSHQFGLGTDQILEMTVVLASGEVTSASPCHNPDLFKALRGGGGGTYGVVVSTTIKAYPTHPMLAHDFAVIPINANATALLNVSANILSKYPTLSDAGFSGYGTVSPSSLIGLDIKAGALYSHSFGKMITDRNVSASIEHAKSVVNRQIVETLIPQNGTDFLVTSTWKFYATFEEYYAVTGGSSLVGTTDIILTSRLFDKASLVDNQQKLEGMMHTIFSKPGNGTISMDDTLLYLLLLGGGQVLHPAPYTSVHPSWRSTYLLMELLATWPEDLDAQEIQKAKEDVTFRKMDAMRAATPGMGSYVNEADRFDPLWKDDFWGQNYDWLKSVKEKYDPDQTFWCYPCVGSESWAEKTHGNDYGPLCRTD